MKRIIVSVAAIFILGITVLFANNVPAGDNKAKENFKKEFPGASVIKWEREDEYLKVFFVLNDVRVMAYFDKEGGLQGSMNAVFFDQLPIAVRTSFDKRFSDAVIFGIYEIKNLENTRYKFMIEMKGKKYIAFLYHDGTVVEIQKG